MTTQNKLVFFATIGFGVILLATRLDLVTTYWRGMLLFSGGWMMAVGVLYQVKLYAQQKDVRYYVLLVFAGVFWTCMILITLFWLGLIADAG